MEKNIDKVDDSYAFSAKTFEDPVVRIHKRPFAFKCIVYSGWSVCSMNWGYVFSIVDGHAHTCMQLQD